MTDTALRYNWTKDEVQTVYETPLPELVYRAQTLHRNFHAPDRVQTCQLISIKTGGCPEDCAYCPQSAHYDAGVARQGLLDARHVIGVAREGTSARAFVGTPYVSAGKTGTAQLFTIKQGEKYHAGSVDERLRDHAWYLAYAPADRPRIALAVLVENGGFGAQAAAPVARAVFDYYLLGRAPGKDGAGDVSRTGDDESD